MMNGTILNFTPTRSSGVQIVTYTQHVFGITEIIFIVGIFIFLAYWYIKVSKDKEKYTKWINPNNKEINLYKIIRRVFWIYVLTIIILGGLTILFAPK